MRVRELLVGEAMVQEFEPTMGAEDFSYFLQGKPGAYFVIGNGDGMPEIVVLLNLSRSVVP